MRVDVSTGEVRDICGIYSKADHMYKTVCGSGRCKDTEYTAEDPAYDLNQLKLENDTSLRYGSSKKYRIKAGSKLPDGLILQDGKVVGTPADTAETTETVFRITGRNGSEAECRVVFTVEDAGYKVTDLTKELDVKYSDIDLKGHSVVIMSDASDGSGKKYRSIRMMIMMVLPTADGH